MIGGLASGWCADTFGRKGGMLLNNILAVIAAILMGSAKYVGVYFLIMVGRVIIGISSGLFYQSNRARVTIMKFCLCGFEVY